MNITIRPRRLRNSEALRRLTHETRVSAESLVYPLFAVEGSGIVSAIESMPGQYRYSPDEICAKAADCIAAGVDKLLLFGVPKHKDGEGSGAWDDDGVTQNALRSLKANFPKLLLIADVCLCEYTAHGHCGAIKNGELDNDATLELLGRTAVSLAKAGADIVAPSAMCDGQIAAVRAALDAEGFSRIPVMSYAVKYASAFYGPFRTAAASAPKFGGRGTYQMDYGNSREALKEAALDVSEGADILMVKPALAYMDVIAKVKAASNLPLAAYSVSGEYSMIKAAAKAAYGDEYALMLETAAGVYRAGADILISYFAPELANAVRRGDL
ncbi:MAG: porphobilinogen synthase [Oscillospiraceae bacterium]|jgi:porphobilinogen synthase|nr:porphobilinogen synthase [Oscillospiraceae bacterium]